MIPGFYTTSEAAERTGTTPVLWRNRAAGVGGYEPIAGAVKVGRDWLIPVATVDAYERGCGGRPRVDGDDRS